jgi:hypothetical protein
MKSTIPSRPVDASVLKPSAAPVARWLRGSRTICIASSAAFCAYAGWLITVAHGLSAANPNQQGALPVQLFH